jgi:hypothetical protein
MKYFPSLSAPVNMHDDATSDKVLSTSKRQYCKQEEQRCHTAIGEWEIVGFAAKRATTSYLVDAS